MPTKAVEHGIALAKKIGAKVTALTVLSPLSHVFTIDTEHARGHASAIQSTHAGACRENSRLCRPGSASSWRRMRHGSRRSKSILTNGDHRYRGVEGLWPYRAWPRTDATAEVFQDWVGRLVVCSAASDGAGLDGIRKIPVLVRPIDLCDTAGRQSVATSGGSALF